MKLIRTMLAATIVGLLLSPGTVAAEPDDDRQETRLQRQTIHLLASGDPSAQERALQLVIRYAHAGTFDADFYRPITPHLATLLRRGETDALRVMAVSALATIDTPRSMQWLAERTPRLESERVQAVANRVLAQHHAKQQAEAQERRVRRIVWHDWV